MSMTARPWAPERPAPPPPARQRAAGWVARRRVTTGWVALIAAAFVIACLLESVAR